MASLVNYLVAALPERLPGVEFGIVDTYGPGAFYLMPLYFARAILHVIGARLAGRVDVLHIHMAHCGSATRKLILALVAKALGVRTVMHVHGSGFDIYCRALPEWRRRALVAILRHCERVVVIGEYWRRFVVGEMGLDPVRIVLIHNGVPRRAGPKRTATDRPAKLLMLGEIGPRKGTPELIAALATPELRQRAWTATLAGNGPVESYRVEVARLGLADRVALPGWQSAEQVAALLADADVFVLPSRREGLPVAILEAMGGGAAVISTPVGAIGDAIIDGETGLLVPPGDAPALAAAIAQLLDDPALRARLAANARKRFEAKFTIDRAADATAAMYRELGLA